MIDKMIYFIQMGEDGPIKIGETKHIHERLSELQVSNPYKLRVLWIYNGRKYGDEDLHEKYEEYNIRGEWFWPVKEILEFRNIHYLDCYQVTNIDLARCWEDMELINFEHYSMNNTDATE
jgi:hypothetical protein